tara:strand:+ start:351 stop:935 length:585 start_codon:yes stop_codon:yes gene_type:complete
MNCNIEKNEKNKFQKLNQLSFNQYNNKFQKIKSKDYFQTPIMCQVNNKNNTINKINCNTNVYVTNDVRLVDPVYGNIMPLDKIPERGYTDISKIYGNNDKPIYNNYSDISYGNIEYYKDSEPSNFLKNKFLVSKHEILNCEVIDPMFLKRNEKTLIRKTSYNNNVSDYQSERDMNTFREDMMFRTLQQTRWKYE